MAKIYFINLEKWIWVTSN